MGAESLQVLRVIEVFCPKRPGVALLASRDVGEGQAAMAVGSVRLARCSPAVRPPGGALRVVAAGRGLPSVVHGSCGGRTLRRRATRGLSGLGLGQVDREGPDLLTFFDHLESDGEGHSVAEDHIRNGDVTVLGLVLHPRREAEGACGDSANVFAEDLEERVAGDALGAPDVHASEVTRLLDNSPAFREDILEGAFVLGEESDLVRLHAGVHESRVVFEDLPESRVDETSG